MADRAYEDSQTVVANAQGVAGIIFACPGPPARRLTIASIALLVTGSTLVPFATIYDGNTATPGRVRAAGRIGDKNTITGDAGDVLFSGQQIFLQWTGCTPGASCNAVLRGTAS